MKKGIVTVFGVILVLMVIFLVFKLVFGVNIIQQAANAVIGVINGFWKKLVGNSSGNFINAFGTDTTDLNNTASKTNWYN